MTLNQGTLVERYRVNGLIGSGAMGEVYLAVDDGLGRWVAVKILLETHRENPELRARFIREARAVARISHPNVVQVFATGEFQGRPYFAMEYLQGKDLGSLVRAQGPFDSYHSAGVVLDAARGLQAAAQAGLIHRDVKPSNLVRLDSGPVKVTDFGLAKPLLRSEDPGLTALGVVVGTPDYIAPEQARGDDIDARVDVYALGCTLFYVLAGPAAPPQGERRRRQVHEGRGLPPARPGARCAQARGRRGRRARRSVAVDDGQDPRRAAELRRPHRHAGVGARAAPSLAAADRAHALGRRAGRPRPPSRPRSPAEAEESATSADAPGRGSRPARALAHPGHRDLGRHPRHRRRPHAFFAQPVAIAPILDAGVAVVVPRPDAAPVHREDAGPHVPAGMLAVVPGDGKPSFYVDRVPVSNRAYAEVVRAHRFPAAEADRPVVGVAWKDARAYAAAKGKRLLRIDEWDAALGTLGFVPAGMEIWEWVDDGQTAGDRPVRRVNDGAGKRHPGGDKATAFRLAEDAPG